MHYISLPSLDMHTALPNLASNLSVDAGANVGAYTLTVVNKSKGKEEECNYDRGS
ncbi:MAG TPA: hypothetical protein VIR31_07675 [Nitrososphaeraceae archaeon]|jgi:hypothetical protein